MEIGSKLNFNSGATYHTVKKGETVSELAKKYGSTIKQIKNWNDLDNNYTIYVGESLRVE